MANVPQLYLMPVVSDKDKDKLSNLKKIRRSLVATIRQLDLCCLCNFGRHKQTGSSGVL